MPEFSYRAADNVGRLLEGRIDASDAEAATRQLRAQGLIPIEVQGAQNLAARLRGTRKRSAGGKANQADVLAFTSELAIMLRAGLSLDRALRVLIGMSHKQSVADLLAQLLESVKGGASLSRALEPYRALVGDFYVNMVRSGETGGQLSDVLSRLVEHLERMRALRDSIVSAMIYPAILVGVAAISIAVMLGFVVPQFESLFRDMGDALPMATRIVLDAGGYFRSHGFVLVGGFLGGAAVLAKFADSAVGKRWLQGVSLRLPVVGAIVLKYEITRFARSLGTLLGNGVPIIAALRIATDTMSNLLLRHSLEAISPAMKGGGRIADAMQTTGLFEPLALNLVRVGEETGRLDVMLLELAKIFDRDVENAIKRGLALLEPLLILVMGMVIATLIVSILMGILAVNDLAV
jgi:general secretion pathway protein F